MNASAIGALTALAVALIACGPSEPAPRAGAQPFHGNEAGQGAAFTSGTLAERYFPLVDGYVYS